jgi:dCTP deaminase
VILSSVEIANRLKECNEPGSLDNALVISPSPDIQELENSSCAAIDLRLGTWFLAPRASNHGALSVQYSSNNLGFSRRKSDQAPSEHVLADRSYVHFGSKFILHPRRFVLAATLEWVKLPNNLCGYVTGKSSWGRLGLVIETAPGVHPGFAGCLTLELANVGEMPIELKPGLQICQLFLHMVKGGIGTRKSKLSGSRLPKIGVIHADDFASTLNSRSVGD